MIPAPVAYSRAGSLDEALAMLAEHGEAAKLLAGGQSLIPILKFRLAAPDRLIDIGRVDELRGISASDGGFRIGALTTYREVLEDDALCGAYPLIREVVEDIGDIQVRNLGTVGGSLAHADPASDFPALAMVLDAEVEIRSRGGSRREAVTDFITGPFTTDLSPDEILAAVHLPPLPRGAGTAWFDLPQAASGYSLVGVAAVVSDVHGVLGSGTVNDVRVAVTGAAEAPFRARAVEEALTGTACNEVDLRAAAAHATDGQELSHDIHADAEYRASLAQVYVRRALERALKRAG
ncbi:MAG: FAD binding domain-containing protein [Candidatus Limnocylindria bacterium]